MGRDELSEEYYDEDDMWLSDDDWDEMEPPSEETLSKLRECFPRMSDDAKLKLVMALAEMADDDLLYDLMGASLDDSKGIDTSDVEERTWRAVRKWMSDDRREGNIMEGLPEYIAIGLENELAYEFEETIVGLAEDLRTKDSCTLIDSIAYALLSFPDKMSDEYSTAIHIVVDEMRETTENRTPRYVFM